MRHRLLARLSAPLLFAVFAATGGLRALDAALYHRASGANPVGAARLYSSDSPRAHYDQCVLGTELRGFWTLTAAPKAPAAHPEVAFSTPAFPLLVPRSSPHRAALARAPPTVPA